MVEEESYRPTLEGIYEDDENVHYEYDFEDFHFGALFEETFILQHKIERVNVDNPCFEHPIL